MEEHGPFCNCEDCWWGRDCREICPVCGCIVDEGCPCSEEEQEQARNSSIDMYE